MTVAKPRPTCLAKQPHLSSLSVLAQTSPFSSCAARWTITPCGGSFNQRMHSSAARCATGADAFIAASSCRAADSHACQSTALFSKMFMLWGHGHSAMRPLQARAAAGSFSEGLGLFVRARARRLVPGWRVLRQVA